MVSAAVVKVAGGLAILVFPISYYTRLISLISWIQVEYVEQE